MDPGHFTRVHCPSILSIHQPPPLDPQCTASGSAAHAFQSLDTVRSLHQTVVSLRNALDDARREIESLKKQINIKSDIEEGKLFKEQEHDIQDQEKSVIECDQTAGRSNNSRMASQIDVKIRVSSNIKMEKNNSEKSAARPEETAKVDSNSINPEVIQIRVTSQENVNITHQNDELKVTESTHEHLSLDLPKDEEDENSLSEGDNSVFDDTKEESKSLAVPKIAQKLNRSQSDNQEEVDDIELIFHSDEHKEVITEEDMVSISVYEPWQKPGESGTPVLISFEKISSENLDYSRKDKVEDQIKQRSVDSSDFSHGTKHPKLHSGYSTNESSLEKDAILDHYTKQNRDDNADEIKSVFSQSKWSGRKAPVDISKCGIVEETLLEMGRRNTCPNPPVYRPIIHQNVIGQSRIGAHNRCALGVKFSRTGIRGYSPLPSHRSPRIAIAPVVGSTISETVKIGPKRSSSVQTEISALPEHWQSESHLAGGCYGNGLFTLPSKFAPISGHRGRLALRPSEKTQESRRIMLSDINFTSMVPELSRSADHLCPDGEPDRENNQEEGIAPSYCKGNLLKTPEIGNCRNLTTSASLNSQGSMNENSYATQTTQTGDFWINRGDSFDSTKSYSMDSRYSLNKDPRSRSVPSIRCTHCKKNHGFNLRTSESMHYTPRVIIQEPYAAQGVQGSLPDLRHDCNCPRRYHTHSFARLHGESSGSTDSLIDEAEDFLRRSANVISSDGAKLTTRPAVNRRCSENDIERNYAPSKQNLPFLPKTAKCLKPGHLAKVIAKNGRVVVGQVRYIGPIVNTEFIAASDGDENDTFVGLELANNFGDCDGSIEGKRFFHCEPLHGIFVPFKKVIMAWTS